MRGFFMADRALSNLSNESLPIIKSEFGWLTKSLIVDNKTIVL